MTFCTLILLLFDQGSKFGIERLLQNNVLQVIPDFFQIEMVYNRGAAWSIFNNQILFLVIVGFVSLYLLVKIRPDSSSKLLNLSYSLLYAGIIGNLIDRLFCGHVRDFLAFQFFSYQFPIFNLADIWIVIGAFMLFIIMWKKEDCL